MSFNLANDSKELVDKINSLIDEKLEKFRKEQNNAIAVLRNEISSSVVQLLGGHSGDGTQKPIDVSSENMVKANPSLSLPNAVELKKCHAKFNEAIKKFDLEKGIFTNIYAYVREECFGRYVLFTKVTLKDPYSGHEEIITGTLNLENKDVFKDQLRLMLSPFLNQVRSISALEFKNVRLDQDMKELVLQAEHKIEKVVFDNDWTKDGILLSNEDFLEFCQKVKNISITVHHYPRSFLNDEFMMNIIKMDNLTLMVTNMCGTDDIETTLGDATLRALDDGNSLKLHFDVLNYRNSFTVGRIRKLIQRSIEEKVEKLTWEFGTVKSDQKTAALLLMQEINDNPRHPYRVHMPKPNLHCKACHGPNCFLLVERGFFVNHYLESDVIKESRIKMRIHIRDK